MILRTAILLLAIFLEYGSIAKKLKSNKAFNNTDVELDHELEVRRCQTSSSTPKVMTPTHQPKAVDNFQTSEDILIQCMLQQNREKGSSATGGWSNWSDWSTCSRTCDGGVAQQIRRCNNRNRCKGDTIRFRICNMQPCPEQQDFRAHQCAAYNDVPYDGTLYMWTTHYDYMDPCALTCRGRPSHLSHDVSQPEVDVGGVIFDPDESDHYDEPSVIVQLSSRVQDGTRCRAGSLDMCIQGKCQRIGCDLKIGSTKKIDGCGVCGGGGKSCSQPLYHWETAPMSLCSVTCGGGFKMSRPTCRNRVTDVEVEDSLCSATDRPDPSMVTCNTHACPPKWIAEDIWGPCSRLCGPGYRERIVACVEETNGIRTRVPDILCRLQKPPTQESCMVQECPKSKEVEEWSGEQDADEVRKKNEDNKDEADEGEVIPVKARKEVVDVDDSEQVPYNDQPIYGHQQSNQFHLEELPPRTQYLIGGGGSERSESQHPLLDPTFIKDREWSACSVTCGEGIRRRPHKCKIFLEYSRSIATVNDSLCEGPKPHDEVERCAEEPCILPSHGYDEQYPRESIKVGVADPGKTYVWREQGYTSCSASCLGGVEELIINCVREDNGRVVSPFLCSPEIKPEARVRTCNDRPCPPRWNYSDYTPCSKSCGIGIKTREVQCIHEVTRGGENAMVVPNSMCPQPPPADRQYCNVLDCPVQWEVGEWAKCSHTCGYGVKERKVECKQIMAQEHKIERPETMCPSAKPADKKPCNVKPCPPDDPKPNISIYNSTHIQHDPKKSKITLKVGGAAVVFFGIQVKIKCPVKRFNQTKIRWTKDHKPLTNSRKFKVSKKGTLRVLDITFRDAGVYSCHAGLSTAEINIDVKMKPGTQLEDYEKHKSDRLVRERSGTEPLTSADKASDVSSQNMQIKLKLEANGKERSRNQKSDRVHYTDSSILEDENRLIQQTQDGVPQMAASSSGNRAMTFLSMPYFHALLYYLQFLWPFNNSKRNRLLIEKGLKLKPFQENIPTKPSERIAKELIFRRKTDFDYDSDNNDSINHGFYLIFWQREYEKKQRRNTHKITLKSYWSECFGYGSSGTAFKNRFATCLKITPDVRTLHTISTTIMSEIVKNVQCEDDGLNIPDAFETCGNDGFPQCQVAGEWTICERFRCFSRHTAIQKQEVICKFINDTLSDKCNKEDKTTGQRECYKKVYKGIWRVEPWSECDSLCVHQVLKCKKVQCVCYGTRQLSRNISKHQSNPAEVKLCKRSPCSTKANNRGIIT
ncbi:protein madd-4-like [Eupeodes corollae]|uniref:protein madd-4-like n=1 Tax=Eupeodes corollae TaxID=290404 RepID=UPI002492AE42|nr:protein madd-4-like [Eupeodes corollae]